MSHKLTIPGIDPSVAFLSFDTEFKPPFITEDSEGRNLSMDCKLTLYGAGWKVLASADVSYADIARTKPMTYFSKGGWKFMKELVAMGATIEEGKLLRLLQEKCEEVPNAGY